LLPDLGLRYERYGADLMHRTLINRLLSHLCCIEMAGCVVTRVVAIAVYCFSPFPDSLCDGLFFATRLAYVLSLAEITIRQLIKVQIQRMISIRN
jgi:hypothetical protein